MSARALIAISAGALVATTCLPDTSIDSGDVTAPRVVQILPGGRLVRQTDIIELRFSEEMSRGTLDGDHIVVAPTEIVSDSFISDLNNPPLTASRQGQILPIAVEPKDGNRAVSIVASGGLPAASQLTLVVSASVSDLAFNPLVGHDGLLSHFRFDFMTDDGAPHVVGTDLPAGDPAEVPPNLRSVEVRFDQAVYGVDRTSLTLSGAAGAADPVVLSVETAADRLSARLRLDASGHTGCQTLCPLAQYTLSGSTAITDVDGVGLEPFSLTVNTLAAADLASPQLIAGPTALVGEDSALIRWETDEPATSAVRLGDTPALLTRWILGEQAASCEGSGASQRCAHAVLVDGLDLGSGAGRDYYYVVESVDQYANAPMVAGPQVFTTRRLPRLAINEVYVNPPGTESESEFVEIINYSDTDSYDLSEFSLRELDGTATADLVPAQSGGPSVLAPGSFAVAGARVFDASGLGVPGAAVLLTDAISSRSTLLNSIENGADTRKQIGLFHGAANDAGAPMVSSYGAPAGLYSGGFPEGVSAERLAPTAPDAASNWCLSSPAPTPGSANTVLGLDTCP